jgi:hypothetical protein
MFLFNERQITMTKIFTNYVTLHGSRDETDGPRREIQSLYVKLHDHDAPEMIDYWEEDFHFYEVVFDPFETDHWDSPNTYLSELSLKYPNVGFQWCYSDESNFYATCFWNGHPLVDEHQKRPVSAWWVKQRKVRKSQALKT